MPLRWLLLYQVRAPGPPECTWHLVAQESQPRMEAVHAGVPLGKMSLFATFFFIAFFAAGAGPLPFIYLSEVLGAEPIKGPAASLATAVNWLLNLCVGLSFPLMLGNFGVGGSFLIYAAFNAVGAILCAALMVETKQRSLDDIRTLLETL